MFLPCLSFKKKLKYNWDCLNIEKKGKQFAWNCCLPVWMLQKTGIFFVGALNKPGITIQNALYISLKVVQIVSK